MAPKRPHGEGALKRRGKARSKPRADASPALFAALDLGTNSCRMLVATPGGGSFRVVDSFSKTVQLGAGLEQTGQLSRTSMNRTIQALTICKRKLERHKVRNMRLVATEACRRAKNGRAFVDRINREVGLNVEIISALEEARLAVISCSPLVSPKTEQLLVVDIGGGSTELVWIDISGVPKHARRSAILNIRERMDEPPVGAEAKVIDWISVPLGVATLRDQFRDVASDAARFALMSWYFEESLSDFKPYQNDVPTDRFQIVGTSGTITTVAASHLGLRRYDRSKVDGLRMTSDEIDRVIRGYLSLGPGGRRADPRIGQDRHALIMSGAAILQALIRCWPTERLSVADRGLREGLLYALMSAEGALELDG